MRLATVETPRGTRAAAFDQNHFVDVNATDSAIPSSVREILTLGTDALVAIEQACRHSKRVHYPADQTRLLPPVPDPQKIVCLGRNYAEHAKESGSAPPTEPILFSKYATALVGHEAEIVLPRVSKEVDFEAELVIVVGKKGRPRDAAEAMSYVAGYTIGHDVSARDWQMKKEGKQWMAGKTFDTFAPTGPHLVTADEIPDPHQLGIRLLLNGAVMQDSNTREMIFKVGDILAYLGQILTLTPGDLVFTGTPPGVGFARTPPIYLKPGDVVEVAIEPIGLLRNRVVAAK